MLKDIDKIELGITPHTSNVCKFLDIFKLDLKSLDSKTLTKRVYNRDLSLILTPILSGHHLVSAINSGFIIGINKITNLNIMLEKTPRPIQQGYSMSLSMGNIVSYAFGNTSSKDDYNHQIVLEEEHYGITWFLIEKERLDIALNY